MFQARSRAYAPAVRIIIDTDPAMGTVGGDPEDSLAIILALNSPEVELEGITIVQGNAPAEMGYSNARHLLTLLGREDVPLLRGCSQPMNSARTTQIKLLKWRYEMKQITETVEPPPGDADAVSFLIDVVQAKPGQITLVTIGPLTNVATAMQKSQAFTAGLRGVVMMGGTVACAGNITPAAEFNFWQDPEAADVVFRSGAPLTMVGLDVCHKTRLLPERLEERAAGGSELGRFVLEATAPWFKAMAANEGREGLHLYDSLAMAVAIDPRLIELDECYVEIDAGNGAAQGMSVAFQKPFQRLIIGNPEPNANVALDVAADRFSEVFNARVLDRI